MKTIALTQGKVAQVSDHQFEYLNQWKWQAHKDQDGKWYAIRTESGFFRKPISMHREIMNTPAGMECDHKDGDGLNNQNENLRNCTRAQNAANRKMQKDNTSGYKGVSWRQRLNKWEAQIQVSNKKMYLGVFTSAEDAARAYDVAAKKHYGDFALLNFGSED